jgi:hypothetical protein
MPGPPPNLKPAFALPPLHSCRRQAAKWLADLANSGSIRCFENEGIGPHRALTLSR